MLSIDEGVNTMHKDTSGIEDAAKEGVKLVYEIVELLSVGLSDNWSQVRYAASLATRCFLLKCPVESRAAHYKLLLPRMCLNRYYVAEGVRIYSQETWKLVLGKFLSKSGVYMINIVVTFVLV